MSQMFALAKRMGYEMRLIARRANQPPGSPSPTFSAGMRLHQNQVFQVRSDGTYASSLAKETDSTLPFKPPGWNMQSDDPQQRNTGKRHLDRDLTQTGLNAIHQDYVSSSSPDSTHTSEIFNSHHKSDSVIRNSVLFLDQNTADSPVPPELKLLIV